MATIGFDRSKPIVPDVNQWHFVVDWAKYAGALGATNLCLAKVGNGDTGGTDARFEVHAENARRRGLIFGGYWYSPRQTDLFLQRFPPQPNAFPIIDFEGKASVKDAVAAAEKLETEWGFTPMFYGRSKWIDLGQPTGTIIQRCLYWGSEYGPALRVPEGVGTPVMWQLFGGEPSAPGPAGSPQKFAGLNDSPCDINMVIDFRAIQSLLGGQPAPAAAEIAPDPRPRITIPGRSGMNDDQAAAYANGMYAAHQGQEYERPGTYGEWFEMGWNAVKADEKALGEEAQR